MMVRALLVIAAAGLLASCGATLQVGPNTQAAASQPAQPPQPTPSAKTEQISPQQRSLLRTDLAAGYYERGQMAVALEELNEAVKLDPNNGRAYNIYGLVYAMLGENAKAEESFQKGLALAPNDSDIHHNWGWYLCTHGKPRESIGEFEAALRNPLYRTPEIALINAGRCSASFGDVKAAETYYRRALAVVPGDANALYGLALMSYKAARYDEARNWMKLAVGRPNPAPETLYLGMCIERSLGDRQAELSYMSQLRNRYPDSAETRAIASGSCE
ncbi:MAG TPA: type IV pilus biogenesis/stability protein PilW [Casimicrobiaceae bacterium]|nr:type IV pilus biogenesis/stability protein PilW [Casimicrobiaceae bacterium]